jgi:hypothetical protein
MIFNKNKKENPKKRKNKKEEGLIKRVTLHLFSCLNTQNRKDKKIKK